MGHATGIGVPVPGGCGRPPPCLPPGRQRALRATPGVPASPRLCSSCPYIGGISWVLWPPLPEEAAQTCRWRPPAPGRRVRWPAEPCAAPARGPAPTRRGLLSRARVETIDGVALRVGLLPLLPVCGADLAVGLASPPQVVEDLVPVVHCRRDRQLDLQVGGERRRRPHPRRRRPGVVLRVDLEQEGVVFALPQHLDDHAIAVRYADHSLRPRLPHMRVERVATSQKNVWLVVLDK